MVRGIVAFEGGVSIAASENGDLVGCESDGGGAAKKNMLSHAMSI